MLDQTTQPTLLLNQIKIGPRARREMGDIAALAAEIDAVGLLQPVVVSKDNELIAGARRIAAWRLLGKTRTPIPCHIVDLAAIARGEWSENIHRKNFTPSEAVALARAVEPMIREQARARQAHGKTAPGRKIAVSASPVHTRKVLESHCGLSGRTLSKAMHVIAAAEREPDKFAECARQMDTTGNVDAAYRAVIGPSTMRHMKRPTIFNATKIGGVPLGDLSVPELRWLVAFFGVIGADLPVPSSDAMDIDEYLTVKQVRAAIAKADAARTHR